MYVPPKTKHSQVWGPHLVSREIKIDVGDGREGLEKGSWHGCRRGQQQQRVDAESGEDDGKEPVAKKWMELRKVVSCIAKRCASAKATRRSVRRSRQLTSAARRDGFATRHCGEESRMSVLELS